MLKSELENAFNHQINAEIYSAYLYLAMAAWLERRNLPGISHWMVTQSQEELAHAMLLYRFVLARGGKVDLMPVAAPPQEWESPLACVENVLKHERHVTGLINALVEVAVKHGDKNAENYLAWFVEEQEEEEESAALLVEQVKNAGSPISLNILDKNLSERKFSMPGQLKL